MIKYLIAFTLALSFSCCQKRQTDVVVHGIIEADLKAEVKDMFRSNKVRTTYFEDLSEESRSSKLARLARIQSIHENTYKSLLLLDSEEKYDSIIINFEANIKKEIPDKAMEYLLNDYLKYMKPENKLTSKECRIIYLLHIKKILLYFTDSVSLK